MSPGFPGTVTKDGEGVSFVVVTVTGRLTIVGVPDMTGRMVSLESTVGIFCISVVGLVGF